jgi:hypothetical protein
VITITGSGYCLFGVIASLAVNIGVQPVFLSGQLVIFEV